MRTTLTSLLLIFWFVAFGQSDNYIVREDGLWTTVEVHCFPTGNSYSSYYIKFSGDTLVDGINYNIAWISEDELHSEWNFYGFIREDENHQVFLKPPGYMEGKIYDFGVETGDSITAHNIYLNSDILHFVVEQIDSVMMLDRFRKRITLYEYINQKEEVWIEGIGSLFGIMNSCNNAYGGACGGYEALCYEENGEIVYHNENYPSCFYELTVNTPNRLDDKMFSIYPNPAADFIIVDIGATIITGPTDLTLEILTLGGKKILVKNLTNIKNVIYLHDLGRGLYFVNINNKKKTFPRYKLIVD